MSENEIQRKIRLRIADSFQFMLAAAYSIRGRYTATAKFLQNSLPKRMIRLPMMQLVSLDDVGKIMRSEMDASIWDHIEDFSHSDGAILVEKFMETFLKQKSTFAILSHRWSDDEITFQEIKISRITKEAIATFIEQRKRYTQLTSAEVVDKLLELSAGSGTSPSSQETPLLHHLKELIPHISHCIGLVKVIKFCELAFEQYKCQFAWVDACCIDKTSSAELDEAIRSMFRWYRNSNICIVHLGSTKAWPSPPSNKFDSSADLDPWFTRGWTLQELLAPPIVKFFNSRWKQCTTAANDKSNVPVGSVILNQAPGILNIYEGKSMADVLSSITSIPRDDLLSFEPGLMNVRQRLSWASKRATTRVEDMAYCLLGIFNISMPIAYGEGEAAFYRLQATIMERSNDRTLFLWTGNPSPYSSMLAQGPECFSSYYEVVDADMDSSVEASLPEPTFMLTNNGLRIPVSLYNKEYTAQWLQELPGHHLDWHGSANVDKSIETQRQCRLAVLGYSARRPVLMLLFVRQIRNHTFYERYPWQPSANYKTTRKPGNPEIIFIR